MSVTMKNENEVFKILRDSSLAGLEYVLGKNNGVEVMRFAQASFTYSDNLILLNHILTDREGFVQHFVLVPGRDIMKGVY